MFKKWNRVLAFVLASALVITSFGSDFATARVLAEECEEMSDGEGSDAVEEEAVIEESETETE